MFSISRYHKKCRIAALRVGLIAIALSALFIPTIEPVKSVGNNIFTLYVNGNEIGKVDDMAAADRLLIAARRQLASDSDDMLFVDAVSEVVGSEVLIGTTDDEDVMLSRIISEYRDSVKETMQHSYTVKIDNYMVNVANSDEVVDLLEASINRFAGEGLFEVSLKTDEERELPVFVPVITKIEEEEEETTATTAADYLNGEGIFAGFESIFENISTPESEITFDDYDYGITTVSFSNEIEVVESYIPTNQITPLDQAIDEVTKDKEEKTIYEVVSGDTLSGISNKTGISIDDLIALNENLTSINSVIRIGDELTITVPQPELSVTREELVYYEGTYEADVIYQYNDSWYTTTQVTLQDPSSGYHKAVEKIVYLNNDVVSSEIIKEEIVAEAIPKIVEKGTKIPPTYIRPISGGRQTDGFGSRVSTFAGMSSYHRGIDWGTPTGTSVVASCGGTVTQAGWLGTYGYCVFISHPDGRETRYAHLSKVLVSKGQYVSQGQKIALSGNTGASSGPHLHFEIRINGVAVNPLKYLSY